MENIIYVIRPASRETGDWLTKRIPEIARCADRVIVNDHAPEPDWPYASGSVQSRLQQLTEALTDERCRYVWCARGGYGCSDLLPLVDWSVLRRIKRPPVIIGFSDISALHSAVYTQLGWVSLHAPMPATTLWRKDQTGAEIDQLLSDLSAQRLHTNIRVQGLHPSIDRPIDGLLFGGCLSVLTNLIGTAYLPKSLRDHILFFEDTGENPGRIQRMFNQWIQSGQFDGVKAIVLGDFRDSHSDRPLQHIAHQLASRCHIPVFHSTEFGHTAPNLPLVIGQRARIYQGRLESHSTAAIA